MLRSLIMAEVCPASTRLCSYQSKKISFTKCRRRRARHQTVRRSPRIWNITKGRKPWHPNSNSPSSSWQEKITSPKLNCMTLLTMPTWRETVPKALLFSQLRHTLSLPSPQRWLTTQAPLRATAAEVPPKARTSLLKRVL